MESGELRHRVDFQKRIEQQDPETGAMVVVWLDLYTDVPAAIEPLSAREFIAAAAVQSEITTRIVVRQRRGINPMEPKQRILHGVKCCKFLGREIYNPAGMLRDKDSGWDYLTIPCSKGVDETPGPNQSA
jgi:SPP1 family predicted phage head-tail adaptor